ncbi:VIT domain-containing protein [Massilia sp. W12]|uniref:VIT domain-containing protein n=1 Tax=Massilia sp. W12 TaxID=3126507 RepID=UPI0030CCA622
MWRRIVMLLSLCSLAYAGLSLAQSTATRPAGSAQAGATALPAKPNPAVGADLTAPRILPRPPQPPQFISAPGAETPIVLKSLRLQTHIVGGMAHTTADMVFYNPNQRNLEGELQFPLQEQQHIIGFALDIDGKLRAAVPVPKQRGQEIFEEIQREQIDPGLLEMTQGNNFKLRIYPLPPKGQRSVQLRYTENLTRQDQHWSMRMPLGFAQNWQEITLEVHARDLAQAPKVSGAPLAFSAQGRDYMARYEIRGKTAQQEVRLLLPRKNTPQAAVQEFAGQHYFTLEAPIEAKDSKRQLPNQVGILWDSSSSGAKRAHAAELALLDQYFKAAGQAEVSLTLLRDVALDGGSFSVRNGNWDKLRQALERVTYDGASALSAWRSAPQVQEYLLFSDGLRNYGSAPFPILAANQRLYAIQSAASSDSPRLAAWANANRGKLIQLDPAHGAAAAQALLQDGVYLEHVQAQGAGEIVFAERHVQNGMLRIAGKLENAQQGARLQLQLAGSLKHKLEVQIPAAPQAPAHPYAAQQWAQYKMRMLEGDDELHRAQIARLGQQFSIPGRETSLLVLERLEDYLRYEIDGPPELQAALAKLRETARHAKQTQQQAHLQTVLQRFKEKQAWWQKDFPKGDKPAPEKKQALIAEQRVVLTGSRLADRNAAEAASDMQERRRVVTEMPHAAPALSPAPKQASATAKEGAPNAPQISISLKKWKANAPYLTRMKNAKPEHVYAIYLDEKPGLHNSSAFYLDVAELLLEQGQQELGLRVLSNLAEMDLENRALLRILGYRLMQAQQAALALPVFEKVLRLAPHEPQSLRDLALALAQDGQQQRAVDTLNRLVEQKWDVRFPDIELIALAEMNAIIATSKQKIDTRAIDPRLLHNMPLDLRVVMSWDADNSDMDLWVTDPNGEKCDYSQVLTYQGGRMSRDFTQGYGPEEFSLRHAKPGKYRIETNFFGNRQQVLAGATTLNVKLTTGFGTDKQKDQVITLRLREAKDTVFVGEFEVKP